MASLLLLGISIAVHSHVHTSYNQTSQQQDYRFEGYLKFTQFFFLVFSLSGMVWLLVQDLRWMRWKTVSDAVCSEGKRQRAEGKGVDGG